MEKFFFKSFIDLIYNTIASRSGLILLAVFFSTYIRFDAEYLILMSVFFFFLTLWEFLTVFLSNLMLARSSTYYYYFSRYYQSRLWLIYLSYKFILVALYRFRVPLYLQWYNVYSSRILNLVDIKIVNNWNMLLNLYFSKTIISNMIFIWSFFYKISFNIFEKINYSDCNIRKISEYLLLNSFSKVSVVNKVLFLDNRSFKSINNFSNSKNIKSSNSLRSIPFILIK